ncbi:MAG: hypothetical protein KF746_27680 [Chitinophagaceae bacterium]|nr:hypothetical protein [Chitinophagaceae bacterium]
MEANKSINLKFWLLLIFLSWNISLLHGQGTKNDKKNFALILNYKRSYDQNIRVYSYQFMKRAFPNHSYTDHIGNFEVLGENEKVFDEFLYGIVSCCEQEMSLLILYKFCGEMNLSKRLYSYTTMKFRKRIQDNQSKIKVRDSQKTVKQELSIRPTKPEKVENEISKVADSCQSNVFEESLYKGGESAFQRFIVKNINFGNIADSISGKIIAQFKVKLDGTVSDITFLTPPLGGGIEEETVRVLSMLKDWVPAKKNGVPVEATPNSTIYY